MQQAWLQYGIQFKKGTEWSYEHARKRKKIWMFDLQTSFCPAHFSAETSKGPWQLKAFFLRRARLLPNFLNEIKSPQTRPQPAHWCGAFFRMRHLPG